MRNPLLLPVLLFLSLSHTLPCRAFFCAFFGFRDLAVSPNQVDLVTTSHSRVEGNKVERGGTLWRLPDEGGGGGGGGGGEASEHNTTQHNTT